jgi:hypothetical protein
VADWFVQFSSALVGAEQRCREGALDCGAADVKPVPQRTHNIHLIT